VRQTGTTREERKRTGGDLRFSKINREAENIETDYTSPGKD
jgi:hypothetical protein